MKKILILFGLIVVCALFLNESQAQKRRTVYLQADTIPNSNKLTVNMGLLNMDSVTAIQGTVNWDTTDISFDSVGFPSNNYIQLDISGIDSKNAKRYGIFTFTWVERSANFVSELDSTSILLFFFTKKKNKYNNSIRFDLNTNINTPCAIAIPDKDSAIGIDRNSIFITLPPIASDPAIYYYNDTLFCKNTTGLPATYQWYRGNPLSLINGATDSFYVTNGIIDTFTCIMTFFNGISISYGFRILPLPLNDLELSATLTNQKNALLQWHVSNPKLIKNIVIEKASNTDFKFTSLCSLSPSVTSYVDEINHQSATYYRLKVIYQDGSMKYSNIAQLNGKNESISIRNTGKTLKISSLYKGTVNIYSTDGKKLYSTSISAGNTTIEMPYQIAGLAWVEVIAASKERLVQGILVQ